MFFLTCSKCKASIEVTDKSISKMQSDRRAMVMGSPDVFGTFPIDINFGNAGGYGILEIECKECGNSVGDQE